MTPTRQTLKLLVLASVVGVVASAAAWAFLEVIDEAQQALYDELPGTLGFDSTPVWWPLPLLALAGLICAAAITRLPGNGGHVPAHGLDPSPTQPAELPGVMLAALASIALGAVIGPEAPLIALGGGLGYFVVERIRTEANPELSTLMAACGTFAAVSFLFGSPVIAAVLLIEATGIGGKRLSQVLVFGLLAAGIGSLVSIGLGAWTGVEGADSFGALALGEFGRPSVVDFLWTVPVAAAIAVGTVAIFRLARRTHGLLVPRPFALPLVGLLIGGLAIAFAEATDKGADQILFSGQDALGPLAAHAGSWTTGALVLLIAFKGLAYALSLGGFRGGPVFPAMFLGAAVGVLAAELPGFELTPAIAVGIGAASVAALRLPLSSIVLATLLTANSGLGSGPLVIVGVVVALLVANLLDPVRRE